MLFGEFVVLTGLPGKPNSPLGPAGPIGPCWEQNQVSDSDIATLSISVEKIGISGIFAFVAADTYLYSSSSGYTVISLQINNYNILIKWKQRKHVKKLVWILKSKQYTVKTKLTLTPLGPRGPAWPDIIDPSAAMTNPGSPRSPCTQVNKQTHHM